MNEITATIKVDFDDGSDSDGLSAEIDGREDGYNGGKTSFQPGDDVVYLTFLDPGVSIAEQISTLGSIAKIESRSMPVEDEVSFANSRTATLKYPVTDSLVVQWMGLNPGPAALQGSRTLSLPDDGIGVAKVTYNTMFTAYRVTNIPGSVNGETSFTVLIVITGTSS